MQQDAVFSCSQVSFQFMFLDNGLSTNITVELAVLLSLYEIYCQLFLRRFESCSSPVFQSTSSVQHEIHYTVFSF